MSIGPNRSAHRANYTLEMGVWHATCRACGFSISDPARRRAAATYRAHIQEMSEVEPVVIDLTDESAELTAS